MWFDRTGQKRPVSPRYPESTSGVRGDGCRTVQYNAIIFLLAFLVTAMATTIDTPDTDESCAYCGLPIFEHDPICVRDCTADCGAPSYFCNFACLSAYIDERNLALGDACEWSPE